MKLLPVKKKAGSLIHPQQLNQNHNNMMVGTSRWHRLSPYNPTHHPFILSSTPDFVFKDDDDPQLLSPRTFCDLEYSPADWSMKSLLAVLPHSPSPVCSPCESPSGSPSLDAFSSQISKEFSAQTNKVSRQENGLILLFLFLSGFCLFFASLDSWVLRLPFCL